jgi:hypothetical protein
MIISVGGRERLVAMIVSWAIADLVEMGMVGRNTSTITVMAALGLTTSQVDTASIWQTIVSVRGRDRLDTRVLGATSLTAAVSVAMGGLGA